MKQAVGAVKRNLTGFLLVDKPKGFSSNEVLQQVKKLFKAKKAGHAGSLDPLATGMLLICFGGATKLLQFLLEVDKVYVVTAQLGVVTTTSDAEGSIVKERPVPSLNSKIAEDVLEKFRGIIDQTPSMYSALKYKGTPLYEYARKGIEVPRESRKVHIRTLNLLSIDKDQLQLYIHCSKGTYVRTLIEDIGEALGCGAHVINLRRFAVGPSTEGQMVTMETLEALREAGGDDALNAKLLGTDSMVTEWPAATI